MRYMEKRRSDSKAILLNIIWAVLAILVKYAINFLTTPYVTNNIGVEAYGFVSLANTFTSYIDLISIALNSFASRYIAIAYHQNDLKKAEQLYSSVIVADCVLSLLVFVPSLFIIRFLEKFLNIPDLLVNDVKILFIVVLIKYLLTVMQTAFNVSTFIKKPFGFIRKAENHINIYSRCSTACFMRCTCTEGLVCRNCCNGFCCIPSFGKHSKCA